MEQPIAKAPPGLAPSRSSRSFPVLILGGLGLLAIPPVVMTLWTFGFRPVVSDDYAHNVKEIETAPAKMHPAGVVLFPGPDSVIAVDLATQTASALFKPSPGWQVWGAAGPSRRGTLAIIDYRSLPNIYRLHVVDAKTGRDRILFSRSDDVIWQNAVESRMVLASDADIVGLMHQVGEKQLHDPERLIRKCDVELVNLDSGRSRTVQCGDDPETVTIDDAGLAVRGYPPGIQAPAQTVPDYFLKTLTRRSDGKIIALAKPASRQEVQITHANRGHPKERIVIYDPRSRNIATLGWGEDWMDRTSFSPWSVK